MGPKLESWVLDQLDEGYEKSPRMRSVDDQPLQQHPEIKNKIKITLALVKQHECYNKTQSLRSNFIKNEFVGTNDIYTNILQHHGMPKQVSVKLKK